MQAHAKNEWFYFETSYDIPCKSLLQKRDPHFIGVCVGASGVNLISINYWQIIVNEYIIPDTKSPKPTVKHPVIFRGTHGVWVFGNYLKKTEMFTLSFRIIHFRETEKLNKASFLSNLKIIEWEIAATLAFIHLQHCKCI